MQCKHIFKSPTAIILARVQRGMIKMVCYKGIQYWYGLIFGYQIVYTDMQSVKTKLIILSAKW